MIQLARSICLVLQSLSMVSLFVEPANDAMNCISKTNCLTGVNEKRNVETLFELTFSTKFHPKLFFRGGSDEKQNENSLNIDEDVREEKKALGDASKGSSSPMGYEHISDTLGYSRWRSIIQRIIKMPNGNIVDFDVSLKY